MSIIDKLEFSESKWLRFLVVAAALVVAASLISLTAYLMLSGTGVIKHKAPVIAYVEISDQGFSPSVLAVMPNTNVIWVNKSSKNARIAALPLESGDKSLFDSGDTPIKPNQSFSITVKKGVGVSIKYRDALHPSKVGGISIVKVVYQ